MKNKFIRIKDVILKVETIEAFFFKNGNVYYTIRDSVYVINDVKYNDFNDACSVILSSEQ